MDSTRLLHRRTHGGRRCRVLKDRHSPATANLMGFGTRSNRICASERNFILCGNAAKELLATEKLLGCYHPSAAILHPNADGGVFMQRRMFAGLFLVSLFIVSGGGAQQFPADSEEPVWTMESIKVKPEMFGFTLGYLDDNWMREREEAKRQGAVVSYYRIAEEGNGDSDRSIVLLTEFKNPVAYGTREELFASIRKQRKKLPNNTPGVVRLGRLEDLYEAMTTRVFRDYS